MHEEHRKESKDFYEIKVIKKVLDANDSIAATMRRKFISKKVFVLNVMSSPGSGKTSILEKTIPLLQSDFKCAVIVGDICTTNDADRLARSGISVIQINTDKFGGDCHLSAASIEKAVKNIDMNNIDFLIIENIGNLVCPAEFDIGEDLKISILSVTEGEDKPEKYPLMFRESDAVLLNKIDLLPYLDFDQKLAISTIKKINSEIPIFEVSSKTEKGFNKWIRWLKERIISKIK